MYQPNLSAKTTIAFVFAVFILTVGFIFAGQSLITKSEAKKSDIFSNPIEEITTFNQSSKTVSRPAAKL